jgi:hypothetical protein
LAYKFPAERRRLADIQVASTCSDSRAVYIALDVNSSDATSPQGARPILYSVLKGIAGTVGVVAVILFFVGGRAIHEFLNVDRFLAEMEGLTLAAVLGLVAALLKGAADRVEDPQINEPVSLGLGNPQDAPREDQRSNPPR